MRYFHKSNSHKNNVDNSNEDKNNNNIWLSNKNNNIANENEIVIDVIVGEQEEKLFVGCHLHNSRNSHSQYEGFRPILELPKESPSRAYLKIEEAIRWTG